MSSLHEIRAWGQAQDKIIQDYTAFWKRLPSLKMAKTMAMGGGWAHIWENVFTRSGGRD